METDGSLRVTPHIAGFREAGRERFQRIRRIHAPDDFPHPDAFHRRGGQRGVLAVADDDARPFVQHEVPEGFGPLFQRQPEILEETRGRRDIVDAVNQRLDTRDRHCSLRISL